MFNAFERPETDAAQEEPAYVPEIASQAGANYSQAPNEVASYLNAGTYFKGLLRSQRSVGIDGHFEGEIQSEADIVIGREAEVKATVKASNVIVSGRVYGHIACGTLEIQSSGKVVGNIEAGSLLIAMGAVFRGQSVMGSEEDEQAASAFAAPAVTQTASAAGVHSAVTGNSSDATEPVPVEANDLEP